MTPQEKAKQLISRYYDEVSPLTKKHAIQCALIAVDEILSMGIMGESGDWNMAKSYWLEVREEIKKL